MKTFKISAFFAVVFSTIFFKIAVPPLTDFEKTLDKNNLKIKINEILAVPPLTEKVRIMTKSLDCHTLNLYKEARGESVHGQFHVFMTVENRAKKRNLTICQTIYQKKQFSWTEENLPNPPEHELTIFKKRVKSWQKTYKPNSNGVDHYHRTDIKPYWSDSLKTVITIDNHIFKKSS